MRRVVVAVVVVVLVGVLIAVVPPLRLMVGGVWMALSQESRTLRVEVPDGASGTLLVLTFRGEDTAGTHRAPSSYWRSDPVTAGVHTLSVPLPSPANVLVVLDANGNGHPDDTDPTSGLRDGFVAIPETPPLQLERTMADLERRAEDGPRRTVVVEAVPGVTPPARGAWVVLGFATDGEDGPSKDSAPSSWWAGEPGPVRLPVRFEAPLSAARVLVVLDEDGDQRPGSDEWVSGVVVVPPTGEVAVTLKGTLDAVQQHVEREPAHPVRVDASALLATPGTPALLLGAWREQELKEGAPPTDGLVEYLRVEDPGPVRATYELSMVLPPSGLVPFALLDLDGDYLPGPGDPWARGERVGGVMRYVFAGAPDPDAAETTRAPAEPAD